MEMGQPVMMDNIHTLDSKKDGADEDDVIVGEPCD
jgi:hypothetical protein